MKLHRVDRCTLLQAHREKQLTRRLGNQEGCGDPAVEWDCKGAIVGDDKSGFGNKNDDKKMQFMVAASAPDFFREIAEMVRQDPDIDLLSTKGPAAAPTVMVVGMTKARAEQLKRQFGAQILIEQDTPLEMFGKQ